MFTRREFTKLASIAGGSSVFAGEESQPKHASATEDPATVTSGFVQNAGADIYYELSGSGPAVVFAHGLGGNHLSWWQQVPYFSAHYTCVTFAHRGFSPSRITSGSLDPALYEDDLRVLLHHLNLADVFLVAQSMGGRACLSFSLHHPQRVRALVMASTTGSVDLNTLDAADRKTIETWFAAHRGIWDDLRKRGIDPAAGERMAREQPTLEFLYSEIDRLTIGLDKDALRSKLEAITTLPVSELKRLTVPVLFITGADDVFVPAAAAALAKLVPGATLKSVPEAGHSVYFERPEVFNGLVSSFFETHRSNQAR